MAFKRKRVRRGKQIINKLFPILLTKTHIAGGFARWVCSQNKTPIPASDIDIFCEDLATYYEMEGILNERFTFLSENEACRVFGTGWSKIKTIQLIKPREQHAVVTMGKIETILKAMRTQEMIQLHQIFISLLYWRVVRVKFKWK